MIQDRSMGPIQMTILVVVQETIRLLRVLETSRTGSKLVPDTTAEGLAVS
jgi:hypothetical protein